jgi:two-component system chemotaxis response regulator CheB
MDLHLPVMNGLEAIERIMAMRPTPIVVYSSFVDGADRENGAAALAAGAIDVLAKPGPNDSGRLEEYADALRQRLRVAGRVRVITHPRHKLAMNSDAAVSTKRLAPPVSAKQQTPPKQRVSSDLPMDRTLSALAERHFEVLAIGASTGGPQALATLLGDLPTAMSTAIVVVQHMAEGFMEGLVHWLDEVCPWPVVLGAAGKRLAAGTVTVAPSGLNLIVHEHLRVTTQTPPATQYHVPGIDATFSSVADTFGSAAAGLLLTGMGRDGAVGLKRMRDAGALTIGQDEATSAVYGMPAAAKMADAVDLQLPLPEISMALSRMLSPPMSGTKS